MGWWVGFGGVSIRSKIAIVENKQENEAAEGGFSFLLVLVLGFCLPELKDCLPCVGNCSSFARLASVRWVLCALQMCCNVRWVVRDFALNVLSLSVCRKFVRVAYNGLALGAVADFGAQNCQYTTKVDAR